MTDATTRLRDLLSQCAMPLRVTRSDPYVWIEGPPAGCGDPACPVEHRPVLAFDVGEIIGELFAGAVNELPSLLDDRDRLRELDRKLGLEHARRVAPTSEAGFTREQAALRWIDDELDAMDDDARIEMTAGALKLALRRERALKRGARKLPVVPSEE